MKDLNQLSINQLTTRDQWSLPAAVDGYARVGVGAMAVWWEKLREVGTQRAARVIRDAGMEVTGYCAGGMLTARDDAQWRQRLDDNRRMVDEAAAIGSSCLVVLGGGPDVDGGVGIAVDTYNVWWDPEIETQIERAAGRIAAYHVSDWLPDTSDLRFDRGMPGDGVIDLRRFAERVTAAGYRGRHEVEILSNRWWRERPETVVATVLECFRRVM